MTSSHNSQLAKKKRFGLLTALIVVFLALVGAGVVGAYKLGQNNTKVAQDTKTVSPSSSANANSTSPTSANPTPAATTNGYDTAINGFINAIRTSNKSAADALQDPAFVAENQSNFGTNSFYDSCASSGGVCQTTFSSAYLNSGTVATKDYKAANGTAGKQRIYTITKTSSNSKSITTITLAAVKNGNSWLIDHFQQDDNNEANL